MATPFIGQINIFGFNFAPQGYAFCDGQLLSISQNVALFSLLGTNYGGNGTSNFGLPNLQDSVPMFYEQGPGLSQYEIGESGGEATVTLTTAQAPSHTHAPSGTATAGTAVSPAANPNSLFAEPPGSSRKPGDLYGTASLAAMAGSVVAPFTGGGQPHNNMQPYLGLNFCIALVGVFPPRS